MYLIRTESYYQDARFSTKKELPSFERNDKKNDLKVKIQSEATVIQVCFFRPGKLVTEVFFRSSPNV
jgi:hypothetical protein